MKKSIIIVLIVFILFSLGIYLVYDAIFPKAEKLSYPDFSSVDSITVSLHDVPVSINQEECRMLYEYISASKPTRAMSVSEAPYEKNFYSIAINWDDISCFGYIYEKQGQTYFEIPYVAIYALDSDALKYIKK
ncbi:MAG: DUF5301 domain-containing protein [Clostridia bacterium]|nr:DUF5301 domain-containing protein [Clostridia bacterium]